MPRPFRLFLLCLLALSALSAGASAAERQRLGYGRLVNNDVFYDLRDRWQTSSFQSSRLYGPAWSGQLPERPGEMLELRLSGGMAAPASLRNPMPGDRPWAGYLGVGLHTHYRVRDIQVALGADLMVTGPQTGLIDLQDAVHQAINAPRPSDRVRAGQIGNGLHPTLVVEMGRSYRLGEGTALRPFVEGRWGLETLARAGMDVTFGTVGQGGLRIRDRVTGQRYSSIGGDLSRPSFVLGADIAQVGQSVLLPEDRGYDLTDVRARVRAGVHWKLRRARVFYGLTWLGPEFEAQPEGQVVGSLRIDLRF